LEVQCGFSFIALSAISWRVVREINYQNIRGAWSLPGSKILSQDAIVWSQGAIWSQDAIGRRMRLFGRRMRLFLLVWQLASQFGIL
jgi:hypothetical protein